MGMYLLAGSAFEVVIYLFASSLDIIALLYCILNFITLVRI